MRETQDMLDMYEVLSTDGHHGRGGVEVVLAIGHIQAALHQERDVAGGVIQVRGDPHAEKVAGV
jgi:hypothetical protein